MKTLTIFTPTYNRANTLPRTYESLCRQTYPDFEWLIIDDGSTDNTRALVEQWQKDNQIPIRYIYQENQGMHGAHNTAYRNITTELNTCVDSDDWMPNDAVGTILQFWKEKGNNKYAGFIGLDINKYGKTIGTPFPAYLKETTLREYYEEHNGCGDKKLVYRTEIITKYPEYPLFLGERYVGLAYKYHLVDEDYKLLTLNKPLVIVDYQEDGSSRSMWKQYWKNPKGFAFYKKQDIVQTKSLKNKLKNNIQYVAHSIRSKNSRFIMESPTKCMTLCSIIPGFFLFLLNWYMVKSDRKM
jgi:glycosyltransferase involved in cell wall biosynthesis